MINLPSLTVTLTLPSNHSDMMQNLTDPKYTPSTSRLPLELLYHVLDQLVATRHGHQPIAYEPSNDITKTLRALTLVSRSIYPIASKYLYSNCLYFRSHINLGRFIRTLDLILGLAHPRTLDSGEVLRNGQLYYEAKGTQNMNSIFISFMLPDGRFQGSTPLPAIIGLCQSLDTTIRRLALNFPRMHAPAYHPDDVLIEMPKLEELILGFHVIDYFRIPLPNLKRLIIAAPRTLDRDDVLDFVRLIPSLEVLICIRPYQMICAVIEALFSAYHGKRLDVVLVDVNSNHSTPKGTRSWTDDDVVRVWEIDVPTSFYGDDNNLDLCVDYMWTHGVDGTLWNHERRRMASWAEIERRLAGPVHTIVDGSHA
jgi:hypothetical protein